MARRRKVSPEEITGSVKDWEVSYEMQINGRKVESGTELKIKGERGRFRFIKHVTTPTTEWIDVWGGPKHAPAWRSFATEKVARVHYKNTTDKALAAEYKAKKAAIKMETEENNED